MEFYGIFFEIIAIEILQAFGKKVGYDEGRTSYSYVVELFWHV